MSKKRKRQKPNPNAGGTPRRSMALREDVLACILCEVPMPVRTDIFIAVGCLRSLGLLDANDDVSDKGMENLGHMMLGFEDLLWETMPRPASDTGGALDRGLFINRQRGPEDPMSVGESLSRFDVRFRRWIFREAIARVLRIEDEDVSPPDTTSVPAHIEIHGGTLKCECGTETELVESCHGGTLSGSLSGCPVQECPGCKKSWWCLATVDCEEMA